MLFVKVAQDVALVLLVIGPTNEKMLTVTVEDLRVMTHRDRVEAQADSSLEQEIELDVSIALNARIRRLPRRVSRDKGRHHVALELLGVVKDVMINSEHLGDATSIVHVGDRAAARVRHAAPQLQRGAHDVVPLFNEQTSRHRRVNAATHRYQNFHCSSLPASAL